MDTTRLLDHYRSAATQDPLRFQVLVQLFHQGRCSESEIASVGAPAAQVRQQLLVLFRANLVRRDAESRWVTTDLANLLLARAGVAESSIDWYIDRWGVPKQEGAFLKSCLRTAEERDPQTTLQTHSLIRALWEVGARVRESEARSQDLRQALYAALVGLDARAESLGHRAFCDYVISRAPELKAPTESVRARWHDLAKVALQDAKTSNHLFLAGHKGSGKSALALTWSRLISAAASRLLDDGLSSLAAAAPDSCLTVWNRLTEWKRDLNEESYHILVFLGHGVPGTQEKRQDMSTFINSQVCSALSTSWRSRALDTPDFRDFIRTGGEHENVSIAKDRVRELTDWLADGVFDGLNLLAKQQLCAAIEVLDDSFRSRLLGREEE